MTDSNKLTHAKGLYLEGIRDGNMREALSKHVGDRYTQHSTGVADGKEGFMAFFGPFLERTPVRDIQVVRAIEDGRYVNYVDRKTPTRGRELSVLEQVFGTIGRLPTDRLGNQNQNAPGGSGGPGGR